MFLDLNDLPPQPPPEPPAAPRLTPQEERTLLWAVCIFLLLLFFAPLAGVTLLDAIWAVVRG